MESGHSRPDRTTTAMMDRSMAHVIRPDFGETRRDAYGFELRLAEFSRPRRGE